MWMVFTANPWPCIIELCSRISTRQEVENGGPNEPVCADSGAQAESNARPGYFQALARQLTS